jgi:hypothetical protein
MMDDIQEPDSALRAAMPLQAGTGERIELMLTFLKIVEAGSLSAAALQLGTTQPTISRRCKCWSVRWACACCNVPPTPCG